MRTRVQGGWVVGFNGSTHELVPDGCVVYEDHRVLFVGRRFDGRVDREIDARGKLVSPGLINSHIHTGINAGQATALDTTKADYFGANYLSHSATRRGTAHGRRGERAEVVAAYGFWSALRGGATTIVDAGTLAGGADEATQVAVDLGIRAYLGPAFGSASHTFDGGRVALVWDEAKGLAGLERAVAYARQYDGAQGGRIRAILHPSHLETCTVDLLQRARQSADELGLPMQLHTANNHRQFYNILEQTGKTPFELLDSIGFLKERTGLAHCVFHNRHSWSRYPYADDLGIISRAGATAVHAPYKLAKIGLALESLESYRQRGINVALGTDTYPQDLVQEMRWAALMCRKVEENYRVGRPEHVFDAVTLAPARALGRDDIGRLAPGAKADIIVVNLLQVHFGAVHDPIKSLMECGNGSDVELAIVDGEILLENGRATRFDEGRLLEAVQAEGERLWASTPNWHHSGKELDEIVPTSYPIVGVHERSR
ncbi:MAG: amidohydrolase family protein [Chloroflexi bacterium]|nr:amidohydrolase family protein [Chloroflexota bacterium]